MPPNKAPIPAASKEAVQTRQALMTPSAIDGSLGGRDEYALIVYEDLGPTRQSQKTKDLRLDLNGDIEFLPPGVNISSLQPVALHLSLFPNTRLVDDEDRPGQ